MSLFLAMLDFGGPESSGFFIQSAFAQDVPTLSSELIDERSPHFDAEKYEKTVNQMKEQLAGREPKKFIVDGVEYQGNYYKSGGTDDIYRVHRNGKVTAIRIPRNFQTLEIHRQFVQSMAEARSHGMSTVEVIQPDNPPKLVVEVEFVQNFQTADEILDHASKNPKSPVVKLQMKAIQEFAETHGTKRIPDFKGSNWGVERVGPNYKVKIIDSFAAGHHGIGDYMPAESYEKGSLAEVFKNAKANNPVGAANIEIFEKEIRYITSEDAAYERRFMRSYNVAEANPKACAPEEVPVKGKSAAASETATAVVEKAGLTKSLGNTMNLLSMAGLLLPLLMPELNPFAGEPIGVDCDGAKSKLGTLRCEWDNKLNPFNNVAYCSRVTKIVPTGKNQFFFRLSRDAGYHDVCEVVYDSVAIRVDDSDGRSALKEAGYFSGDGAKIEAKNAQEILNLIKSKAKVSESMIFDDVPFPDHRPKATSFGVDPGWS